MSARILVTGGAGYLGNVLCRKLIRRGYQVRCCDRLYFGREPVDDLLQDPGFELVPMNLMETERFPELLEDMDAVVHLGGLANDPTADLDPDLTWRVNHQATVELARAAAARGVWRFVNASSCSVYGDAAEDTVDESSPCRPVSLYAESKLRAEAELLAMAGQEPRFQPVHLRQATLFGYSPRMRFDLAVNVMAMHAVTRGRVFVLGGGRQWRPFLHVEDAAEAFVAALEAPASRVAGQILNVGATEANFQIADLARRVQGLVPDCEIEISPDDADRRSYRVRFERIGRVLGWRPRVSVDDGVAEVVDALSTGLIADPEDERHFNIRTLKAWVARPAVEGGDPVRVAFLPLCRPELDREAEEEVLATLRSGWLTMGPRTQRFERMVAEYVGCRHAVALSSCTAALHLSLIALGVGPGDEVITSPVTWPSTANVIVHCGATPVFADVEPDTLNLDAARVEAAITPRTKAIIPVHIAGQTCDMGPILALARRHGIRVVEDAAHALGGRYRGQRVGTLSDLACFSFYATKNITTAEGGVAVTDSDEWAETIRLYSMGGISADAWKRYTAEGSHRHEVRVPGYKYNFTDLQAALGIHQLPRLDEFIERRRRAAEFYDRAFASVPELIVPIRRDYCDHTHHLYIVQLDTGRLRCTRDEFAEALRRENVGTGIHFRSLHLQPYYRERFGFARESFPQAAAVSDRIVSLPLYPGMSDRDLRDVVTAVRKLAAHFRRPALAAPSRSEAAGLALRP